MHQDFLHSKLGWRPSYTWRSIFGVDSILQNGVCCRVGDDKLIQIWNDPWIWGGILLKLVSAIPPHTLRDNATVSELIDEATKSW